MTCMVMPLNDAERELVEEHVGLTHYVAAFMTRYQPDLYGEVVSIGFTGLVEAIRKWDSSRGKFSTFAKVVIRYRIIDEWRTNRAGTMGVSRWFPGLFMRAADTRADSRGMDAVAVVRDHPGSMEREDSYRYLARHMSMRERVIMRAYYWLGMSQASIAAGAGLSESRVCQIMTAAYRKVNARMGADAA